MAFLKQLASKVAIAVAAGAAEQSVRHAVSDAWKKRKEAKGEAQDNATTEEGTTPTNPIGKFFSDKWAKFKADREAREYLAKQEETTDEGEEQ